MALEEAKKKFLLETFHEFASAEMARDEARFLKALKQGWACGLTMADVQLLQTLSVDGVKFYETFGADALTDEMKEKMRAYNKRCEGRGMGPRFPGF